MQLRVEDYVARLPGTRVQGSLLPNDQRQHRTVHIQKDALPYALC
jgi:hypothetical protein